MALRGGVTANARVLLADAVKLASMTTPVQRKHVRFDLQRRCTASERSWTSTHLQPGICWLSDTAPPIGELATTAWLWMVMPGSCCHVEGMRICCVPAGHPCCRHTWRETGSNTRRDHTNKWNTNVSYTCTHTHKHTSASVL